MAISFVLIMRYITVNTINGTAVINEIRTRTGHNAQ